MSVLNNIPYKENIILNNNLKYHDFHQQITLTKYFCNSDLNDRYYLRLNINNNGELINQGYLYFYLDSKSLDSKFIGIGVNPEYRNSGVASLLIANWIQFCFDEGFFNLQTIRKQRKPFLLYLLKKFCFDLNNLNKYYTSSKTVHICRKEGSSNKYLIFANKHEEERFSRSNVMKKDNYKIINSTDENINILDSVVLYEPYYLQNNKQAYQKSLQISNKYRSE